MCGWLTICSVTFHSHLEVTLNEVGRSFLCCELCSKVLLIILCFKFHLYDCGALRVT